MLLMSSSAPLQTRRSARVNRVKSAALTLKLAWAIYKIDKEFSKAEKAMEKARQAEQRALERQEGAAALESQLYPKEEP